MYADLANNPSQTLGDIKTGFGMSYNEFASKSYYEQGKALGNVFGQIEVAAAMAKVAAGRSNTNTQVLTNKVRGDAFRDEIANQMVKNARVIEKEVMKSTPFGKRFIDIEVKTNKGEILGGIETKTGNSRYLPSQRAKDEYLKIIGYPVNVIRNNKN